MCGHSRLVSECNCRRIRVHASSGGIGTLADKYERTQNSLTRAHGTASAGALIFKMSDEVFQDLDFAMSRNEGINAFIPAGVRSLTHRFGSHADMILGGEQIATLTDWIESFESSRSTRRYLNCGCSNRHE